MKLSQATSVIDELNNSKVVTSYRFCEEFSISESSVRQPRNSSKAQTLRSITMPSYQPVSLPRRNFSFLKKPLVKPMKRHLPRPHQPSSNSTIKSSSQTAKEYLRLPMELRRYHKIFNFNQDTVIEWSVRRVQKLLVTVRFEPYTSPIIGVICGRSRPRNCLYCSCLCEKLTKRGNAYQSPPLKCDHCQYYPESHSDRCIGRLKERSGSLAYILRHLIR